jgi:hypothetical protein
MSSRRFTKIFTITLLTITLFCLGRFYKEVNEFFTTPYSVIGLLLSVIGFLFFYIDFLKISILKKDNRIDNLYRDIELKRNEIHEVREKLRLRKK